MIRLKGIDHIQALQLSDTGNINMKVIRNRVNEAYKRCLKNEKFDDKMLKEIPELSADLDFLTDNQLNANQPDDVRLMNDMLRVIHSHFSCIDNKSTLRSSKKH